jgi:hypothetical protein
MDKSDTGKMSSEDKKAIAKGVAITVGCMVLFGPIFGLVVAAGIGRAMEEDEAKKS